MRYLSTFSGIGGFELGIQLAYEYLRDNQTDKSGQQSISNQGDSTLPISSDGDGWRTIPTCIGYSEIDKYATQIYQKHFPYERCKQCQLGTDERSEERGRQEDTERGEEQRLLTEEREGSTAPTRQPSEHHRDESNERQPNCQCKHKPYGDITKIIAEDLPDFDLLVGGFPCQAFSIAGKRGGFEDTRGTMFFELARILRAKQPRLCVFENVKGLLSHDGGKSFSTIIQTLDELGYDCQWQVLNSKNHGVPQNRERVFIIGHLRGTPRPQVFPFGSSNKEDSRICGEDLSYCLDSNYHKGTNTLAKGRRQLIEYSARHESRVYEDTAPTVQSSYGTGGGHVPFVDAIRKLTPTECERLQGFPDGWTEGVSDTQRYKTLGNAVTVNVIRDIFKCLL